MHIFENKQETMDFLKQYKLMPKTFTELPNFYHYEVGSDIPDKCEVVGYDEMFEKWATVIIEVNGKRIHIHSDYLLEMKNRGKSHTNNSSTTSNQESTSHDTDSYIIFDIETTGLNNDATKIIEIAALKISPTGITEFNNLIYIDEIIPLHITALTGIDNNMLVGAEPIELVLPKFLNFIGNCKLVGHNIKSFDIPCIKRACDKIHLPHPTNELIDTRYLAQSQLHDVPNYQLSTLCEYYDIDTTGAHRALQDCYMCLEVYKRLIGEEEPVTALDISDSSIAVGSLWHNILTLLDKIITEQELPTKGLILKENAGKKIASRSICINEPPYPPTKTDLEKFQNIQSIAKIEESEDNIKLSIKESCLKHASLPPDIEYRIKPNAKEAFAMVNFAANDERFYLFLEEVIRYRLKTYVSSAGSFGCCNQHVACSDAKKCLHANKLYSTACQYRHNLENGRIFYGKNRNVD